MKFGEVLRLARERKGIDLPTAARRLRIRPDILKAIEENDFARMPPRGYARNMVNAYARLLGLNPTEITKLYLDEAYAYQVGRVRNDTRSMGSGVSVASTRREARRQTQSDYSYGEGHEDPFGRRQYSDARTGEFNHDTPVRTSRRGGFSQDRTHPSRSSALPNTHYTNFYAGPAAPGAIRSKLPIIIVAAVILVLVIVVLVLLFGGPRGAATNEDVPSVPITGIDDPEAGTEGSGEGDVDSTEPVAPTSVEVTYSIPSGAGPWVDIIENGTTVSSGVVNGPVEETIDVTGTLTISTPQPGNVTVTVDGEQVQLTNSNGGATYSVTVDFNSYLVQWREQNGTTGTDDDSTVANGTNGTTSSNTGTNSTTNNNSTTNTNSTTGTGTGGSSTTTTTSRS